MSKKMFQYTLLQEQTGTPSCCYSVQSSISIIVFATLTSLFYHMMVGNGKRNDGKF